MNVTDNMYKWNKNKTKNLKKTIKLGKGMNKQFREEETQMANKPMKRCSNSLPIWEMKFQGGMRFHFINIGFLKIEEPEIYTTWFIVPEIYTTYPW